MMRLLQIVLLLIAYATSKRLIYVEEVFRHGARYPIRKMTNDKSDLAEEEQLLGELTN